MITRKPKHTIFLAVGIFICVSVLTWTQGCKCSLIDGTSESSAEDSKLKNENSVEYGRNVFTLQEILTIIDRYRYEFQYVVSYLENIGDRILSVAITKNLEQVSFSYGDSYENMTYYVDMGYEKDEEFERCLKTILIDAGLGFLCFNVQKTIYFGPNRPIIYCEYDYLEANGVGNDDRSCGIIEGNWYFYVQEFV